MQVRTDKLQPNMRISTSWSGEPSEELYTVKSVSRKSSGQLLIAFFDRESILTAPQATWEVTENRKIKISIGDLKRLLREAIGIAVKLWHVRSRSASVT